MQGEEGTVKRHEEYVRDEDKNGVVGSRGLVWVRQEPCRRS